MSSMSPARRGIALVAGSALAVLFATAVAAGPSGARHADGTFIDATGSEIGSIHLVEDAQGIVHVNVKVDGLSAGLHGIHIHAVGSCVGTDLRQRRRTLQPACPSARPGEPERAARRRPAEPRRRRGRSGHV